MPRCKDVNWEVHPTKPGGNLYSQEQAQFATLLDIRDELKRLNELLHCQNFIGIPATLKRMDRRMAKKEKL